MEKGGSWTYLVVVVVLVLVVVVDLVKGQSYNYSPYVATADGSGNGNTYPRVVSVNRREQGQGQQGFYQWVQHQKPRRTHYGQTLSRFFDGTENGVAGSPTYAVTTAPRRVSNGRWNTNQNPNSITNKDKEGRVRMGVSNAMCDDAKTNLTVDWDMSPVNHTCYHPESRFPLLSNLLPPLLQCDRLPPRYVPGHVCMTDRIQYKENIPTHGDHRPLWPVFGEYIFVPRERWLHNIEHGAIVMLYHPCAHPAEVSKLKNLVKGCVGKHIITPSTLVPVERPLALVAWSCRLLMSSVDESAVTQFIQQRAHKGPEGTYTKEGQYTFGLLQQATMSGAGAAFGYSRVQCV